VAYVTVSYRDRLAVAEAVRIKSSAPLRRADAIGQALDCFFQGEPGRRSAATLLSKDQARRIAVNVAKLAELVRKPTGLKFFYRRVMTVTDRRFSCT